MIKSKVEVLTPFFAHKAFTGPILETASLGRMSKASQPELKKVFPFFCEIATIIRMSIHSLWTRNCSYIFKVDGKSAACYAGTISFSTLSWTTQSKKQLLHTSNPLALWYVSGVYSTITPNSLVDRSFAVTV
jgi:hypothetical protein